MLIDGLIIALLVLCIHYTMQPGEIFARVGDFLERKLPMWMHKPVFDCPVCMSFWHGGAIAWAFGFNWLSIFIAMGFNIVLNRLTDARDHE